MGNKLLKFFAITLFLLVAVPGVLAISISPSTPYTTDNLACSNPTSSIFKWYRGSTVSSENFLFEGQTLSSSYTSKDQTFTCAAGIDLFGSFIPEATLTTTIINSPPLISVAFSNAPYIANSTLSVAAAISDPDGDSFTTNYLFMKGSTVLQNSTSSIFSCIGNCTKGDIITVYVTSTDSANSSRTESNSTTIQNAIPSSLQISVSPSTIFVGTAINITATANDTDGDSLTFTYQFRNLNDSAIMQNFSSDNTYNVSLTDAHDVIEVTVNATDGTASTLGSANVTIANSAPALNLGNLSFNQDTNLTVDLSFNSSDADNDNITYSSSGAPNLTISFNGSNMTIIPDATSAGPRTFNVTANDSFTSTTQQITANIIDLQVPSVNITAPVNGASFTTTNNVTLNYTAIDNGVLDLCRYTSNFDSGGNLSCSIGTHNFVGLPNGNLTVTFFANDTSNNTANTSISFEINYNEAPKVASLNLTPTSPVKADNLAGIFTLTDRESASLTAFYTWFKNGVLNQTGSVAVTNGTSSTLTLDAGNTSKGENWTLQILPSDGVLNGTAQNVSAIIGNTAPISSIIPDQNWAQDTNQTIDLSLYFSDADTDDLNFTASSTQNLTITIDNLTNTALLQPDIGFSGVRTVIFTAYDLDNANVTSNTVTLGVGFNLLVNSYINGTFFPTGNYSNITGVVDSILNNSNISGQTISLVDVNATNSTIANTTATNSIITNSNLLDTIVSNANITDNVLYSGTMLMFNGTNYNASDLGAQNLSSLINYAPNAVIQSPTSGSFNTGSSISFISGSTDLNIGGLLNDSLAFLWNFGDGTNATTENATHNYNSAGTYNAVLTVTDSFGKSSNSSAVTLTVSTPSSGGGGGGGSSGGGIVLTQRIDLLKTPKILLPLRSGSVVTFNFAGEEHKVTVNSIGTDSIKLTVQSNPVTAVLKKGESAKFDLNNNAVYDLKLTLESLSASTLANVNFELIFEEVPKTETVESLEETSEEIVEEEPEEVSDTPKRLNFSSLTGKVTSGLNSLKGKLPESFVRNAAYSITALAAVAIILTLWLFLKSRYSFDLKVKRKKD